MAHMKSRRGAPPKKVVSNSINNSKQATVVYLRVWKAANNQIREYLMQQINGVTFVPNVVSKLRQRLMHYWQRFKGVVSFTDTDRLFGHLHAQGDACIVTVLRDPISHFLKGYNQLECRRTTNSTPFPYMKFREGTSERFVQFVVDLLSGVFTHDQEKEYSIPHVYSMTGILYALSQTKYRLTAYLPSLDNLATDFPAFLSDSCSPHTRFPVMESEKKQHASSKDSNGFYSAAKAVGENNQTTTRALCALHVMDYACYGKFSVPQMCRDVYAQDDFVHAIQKAGRCAV